MNKVLVFGKMICLKKKVGVVLPAGFGRVMCFEVSAEP